MDLVAQALNNFLAELELATHGGRIRFRWNKEPDLGSHIKEIVPQEHFERIDALSRQELPGQIRSINVTYPVSQGEFLPVTVRYDVNKPITIKDVIESTIAFYQTPLGSNNVQAYLSKNPNAYYSLGNTVNPVLADALASKDSLVTYMSTPTGVLAELKY